MSINWQQAEQQLNGAAARASDAADRQTQAAEADFQRLTQEQLASLLPSAQDQAKLAELLAIVRSADAQQQKINRLVANSEQLAGVMLTLLTKVL